MSELSYRELAGPLLVEAGFEFVGQSCLHLEIWLTNVWTDDTTDDYLQSYGNKWRNVWLMKWMFAVGRVGALAVHGVDRGRTETVMLEGGRRRAAPASTVVGPRQPGAHATRQPDGTVDTVARVAVVTSHPLFAEGGHLVIADGLTAALREAGHDATVIRTPPEPVRPAGGGVSGDVADRRRADARREAGRPCRQLPVPQLRRTARLARLLAQPSGCASTTTSGHGSAGRCHGAGG